ncbi:TIGR01906 family membrane protein [Alkaliphilus serpentinus]|uniref:TIGR01906 family membrane protein n=1 Tax=Alkaliphilus serpentinus TaxID=1482731 RepID=A0A833HNU7_9FIRM|nr:TIGR01906 family membrane protein [Alkaliphilus serpentinus]KAB3530020.1 TIGR01906 family membrane protein [Alkaliphilus serpentinus]
MFNRFFNIFIPIMISLIILLTAVEIIAFNISHYKNSFKKQNITEITGMDMENLKATMEDLLHYLKDDTELLDTKAVVKGELREVYSQREKLHMLDVKNLFLKGRGLRRAFILLLILSMIYIIRNNPNWIRSIAKGLKVNAYVNWMILFLFILMVAIDFHRYFTYFHYLFFTNDLWLLDPSRDILIQMLPEAFFLETAVKIMVLYIGIITLLGVGGYYLNKKTA